MNEHILIVEDEIDLAELLSLNLMRAGYSTSVAHDGRSGLEMAQNEAADLLILDLMLPKLSGLEVASKIRSTAGASGLPILMLTAKADEIDQVRGLEVGADDYLTKPCSMKILLARVEALLRRANRVETDEPMDTITAESLVIDLKAHRITLDGTPLILTLTEFRLLTSLIKRRGEALSRDAMIEYAMGPGVAVTSRTIDVHIASLRKKIAPFGDSIETVRGVGYRFTSDALVTQA